MRATSPFSQPPELLAAFAPEYRTEHYHLHGRNIENWESFKSIFLDEHYELRKMGLKILKGAFVGMVQGIIFRNFLFRGPKKFEMDRLYLINKGNPFLLPLKGYTAFGALMGFVWYVIKDAICLPHGTDTYGRYVLATGLMGGVLVSTIYHPVNFLHGFVAGAVFGGVVESIRHKSYPVNFAIRMKFTDEEKRNRLLREDEEYEMSLRNVLVTKTNLYPL